MNCVKNGFYCHLSEKCINSIYFCDGINDCPLNEDEQNCPLNEKYEKFKCKTTSEVIKYSKLCNFQADCWDNSDEDLCGKKKLSTTSRFLLKNIKKAYSFLKNRKKIMWKEFEKVLI